MWSSVKQSQQFTCHVSNSMTICVSRTCRIRDVSTEVRLVHILTNFSTSKALFAQFTSGRRRLDIICRCFSCIRWRHFAGITLRLASTTCDVIFRVRGGICFARRGDSLYRRRKRFLRLRFLTYRRFNAGVVLFISFRYVAFQLSFTLCGIWILWICTIINQ